MRGRKLLRVVIALLALGVVAWFVQRLGVREVLRVGARAEPGWFLLSLVPLIGRFLIWGRKMQRILERAAPARFWDVLQIQLAGSFVNLTTPTAKLAGGFVRAAVLARRYRWTVPEAYGRVLLDQCTTVGGTLLLFAFAGPVSAFAVQRAPWRLGVLSASTFVLLGAIATLAGRPLYYHLLTDTAIGRWLDRLAPSRFRHTEEGSRSWVESVFFPLFGEGRPLATVGSDLLHGVAATFMVVLSNALVLWSLGVDVDLGWVVVAVVASYFAGAALGAWGGIGVTEATLAALYIDVGIEPEVATAAALLHRACFYGVVLVWGGVGFLRFGRELTSAAEAERSATGQTGPTI